MKPALLVLEDGTFFPGLVFGHETEVRGELVCDTGMANYEELLTDPTSKGRLISLTTNHVGNHGVVEMDAESAGVHATGLIVRNSARIASNFRATDTLPAFMEKHGVVGITEVDTRGVMVHVREHGAQMAAIVPGATEKDVEGIVQSLRTSEKYDAQNFLHSVSVSAPQRVLFKDTGDGYHPHVVQLEDESTAWPNDIANRPEIAVLDLGVRYSLLEGFHEAGMKLTLLPHNTPAADILARNPNGVLLSNGPGNPEIMTDALATVRELLGKVPTFGVGVGFQLLSIALGGETYKLQAGDHGQNIPVRNADTGRADITTHRHGFGVRFPAPPKGLEFTHTNLNDQSVQGLRDNGQKAIGVQHHPEVSLGLHGTSALFDAFRAQIA